MVVRGSFGVRARRIANGRAPKRATLPAVLLPFVLEQSTNRRRAVLFLMVDASTATLYLTHPLCVSVPGNVELDVSWIERLKYDLPTEYYQTSQAHCFASKNVGRHTLCSF